MRRTFIALVAGRYPIANRADPINQRAAKLVQLHNFGLLGSYDIIKFM